MFQIQGMSELNGCEPRKIKVLGPYTFSIGDTTNCSKYVRGGIVTQVKMPKKLSFKPLKESIKNPEFLITDFGKMDYPQQLHVGFAALHKFQAAEGRLPKPWCDADVSKFMVVVESIVQGEELFKKGEIDINKELLETFCKVRVEPINNSLIIAMYLNHVIHWYLTIKFSQVSAGDLNPMNAAIGGVVAQEVMKASSGKFHPIVQWLYLDAIECLPKDRSGLNEESCKPIGCRYDGQIAVFGQNIQKKIGELKYFIVGQC